MAPTNPSDRSGPGPVLVVDDDRAIREVMFQALDMEGYQVVMAADGAEALLVAEKHRPALVLLDMRMPVMDGWGFAREARRRGMTAPIIVVSAASDAQVWCDEIGAEGCVPKPFEVDEILNAVARLVPEPQTG